MKHVPDKPTPDMIAAALPIVELENLPDEAKRVGAQAVMMLSGQNRIKPKLEGEAVVQAAQLYVDYQRMIQAAPAN